MKRRHYGLTLIEILIVIAIIAVLTAFLMPVFNRAKVSAKKVESTQNLRILGLGQLQYAEDNQNRFATYYNLMEGAWYRQIRSYCKTNPELLRPPLLGFNPDGTSLHGTGYALNECVTSPRASSPDASRTVFLYETTGVMMPTLGKPYLFVPVGSIANDFYLQWMSEIRKQNAPVIKPMQSSVYNGVGAYFFLDSHVKFHPPTSFPFNPEVLRYHPLDACNLYPSEVGNDQPTFHTSGG